MKKLSEHLLSVSVVEAISFYSTSPQGHIGNPIEADVHFQYLLPANEIVGKVMILHVFVCSSWLHPGGASGGASRVGTSRLGASIWVASEGACRGKYAPPLEAYTLHESCTPTVSMPQKTDGQLGMACILLAILISKPHRSILKQTLQLS